MATLQINRPGLAKVRRLAGLQYDHELAERINVDATTVSRVLTGKSAPGPRFIAGCVEAFGADCFTDIFLIVPDGDETPAA
ncbi:Cro protein [Mycobacterium phage Aubs]|nr:Cro protein [Mycobacterium phage Aubs]